MKNVYFKRYEGNDPEILSQLAQVLFEHMVEVEGVTLEKQVPIKVHFGEKGNVTYVPAESYNGLIASLKKRGIETSYIETNVLYRGSRTTRDNHLKLAEDHGFTQIPITIADGEMGESVYEVKIDKTYFESVKLGAAFEDYKQILVTAHFKGHGTAGFGGALKQLAMGFASRSGKMAQHSKQTPKVNIAKCTACGLCLTKCDVEAIKVNDFAVIDASKCVGCAGCIAICPVGAITNDWGGENFKEKVAEYAYGADLNKNNLYINFLMNITKECDCMGQHYDPIANHIGVFASMDPVALDTACLDILQKEHGTPLFESGRVTLNHAKKISFGDADYQLIEL
ncbi:MAG: DUF362 domain-containing protein [Clostridia bacterium]|nr:DUF362 domain-containing protein [Clostridia bacterium]